MINIESILSSFDEKGTLLKWLKEVEGALKGSVLTSIEIVNIDEFKIKFNFIFQDGTNILTPVIDLPMHAKFDAYDLLNILEAGDPNIIVDINEAGDKVEIHLDQTFIEKIDNLEASKKNYQGLILKEGLEEIVDKKSFYKYFFDKRNLPTQNYIIEGGTEQTPTNENVINALGGLPPHFKRPSHWFILVKFIGNTNNHYSNGVTLDILLRGSVDNDFYKMYMHSYNGTNATYDTGFVSLKKTVLPIATNTETGGVKAPTKTEEMTEPVGIDARGFLFSKAGGGGLEISYDILPQAFSKHTFGFNGQIENLTTEQANNMMSNEYMHMWSINATEDNIKQHFTTPIFDMQLYRGGNAYTFLGIDRKDGKALYFQPNLSGVGPTLSFFKLNEMNEFVEYNVTSLKWAIDFAIKIKK